MSKKNQGDRVHNTAFEFLRRGEKVPKAFLERRIAAAKQQLADRTKVRQDISQRYATDWSQIQKASKDGDDRRAKRAMEDVLKIHKNLAKKKNAASARIGLGGIVSTSVFGVRITPPFDYAFTLIEDGTVGSPTLDGSAYKNSGQISTSVVTDDKAESDGVVYSEVGIYLRPRFGPTTLVARTNPSSTYQWWSNSIRDSRVISWGASAFGIYDPNIPKPYGIGPYTEFCGWFANQMNDLRFDFATDEVFPVSLQVDNFESPVELALFVGTSTWASGQGWPGSLAGAVMSVAVPSITLEFGPVLTTES